MGETIFLFTFCSVYGLFIYWRDHLEYFQTFEFSFEGYFLVFSSDLAPRRMKKGNIIMIQILQSQQIVRSIVIVYGRNTKALPDIFHSIDCDLEIDTCRLNLWF